MNKNCQTYEKQGMIVKAENFSPDKAMMFLNVFDFMFAFFNFSITHTHTHTHRC
jgi:hypothetical protein